MKLAISGVPGTGKTILAKKLAKTLKAPLIQLNEFVKANKIYVRRKNEEELTVNPKKLGTLLRKRLKGKKKYVIEGHLACEFNMPCDAFVVLRCEPRHLWDRLKKRRYPFQKIRENVLAEILDYCGVTATKHYAHVIEINATKPLTAKQFLAKIKKPDHISWIHYLKTHEKIFRKT